ncbi:type VI secretion system Vgr family protein [Sulfitobacter sp. CW3]|uniref:type VI secretion system Vgr family protein n=1 Tax=Sulfitobacter sp. CW3 TaxID=2861965 RepID=UPI001C5DAB38|nr:type VI secretion system tip protein TssI/VgrG [Sulfitobacter sp. CW3]MBW4964192.1 type VI secretion system tip protein VgrG [Sulfitobacter sp. CW3]
MPEESIVAILSVDKKLDLNITDFSIHETLSEVPTYSVTVLDQSTQLDSLVGVTCEINFAADAYTDSETRSFSGLVMSVERVLDRSGSPYLKLEIRPKLAVLGLSVHSAIYQKSTSLDILEKVLQRNGLANVKVTGTIPQAKRDTVIQYNENDLGFCRRILAEEGLAFYFHDGTSPETLVLHDVRKPFPSDHKEIELTDAQMSDVGRIEASSLSLRRSLGPDKVELTHYDASDADQVTAGPAVSSEAKSPVTPTVIEYRPVIVGDIKKDELKVLTNAAQRPELAIAGHCEHPAMHLGQALDIASSEFSDMAGRYIISSITYTPTRGNALMCRFEAVPKGHVPAPERLPKPLIAGVHNAIVVSSQASAKAGDPACDEKGRVLVQFFWDVADSNSGYIRVSEPFAGKGYGAQFTPRVGHEVLVSFLHGDPDAPVVTGQLYTEKHKPPFNEKNTHKSGFRTQLKDGKQNELEFNDENDKELIGLRAGRDFELIVNENVTREVKKNDTTKIEEKSKLDIGDSWDITVKNDQTTKADKITLTGDSEITLKVGSSKIVLSSSGIVIDAPKVEIKGQSKVDVESKGQLALAGMSSKLEAKTALDVKGMNVSVKGSLKTSLEGTMSEVKGSGMVTIKGGVTMIN